MARVRQQLLEEEFGIGLRDIIIQLYERYRSVGQVADRLRVSEVTLLKWRQEVGLNEYQLMKVMLQRDNVTAAKAE
jgi:DNA-binding MurR/RpiR family transcriptional regulator